MLVAIVGALSCASLCVRQVLAEPAARESPKQPDEMIALDVFVLQRELAEARRTGDHERARALEQQLIDLREERMRLMRFTHRM